MPALPALLLSIHFLSFLLVTMPPRSLTQAPLLSSVRMGEWLVIFPSHLHLNPKKVPQRTLHHLLNRSPKCVPHALRLYPFSNSFNLGAFFWVTCL